MKPNDDSIDDQQLRRIREQARKALNEARAMGRFPTPVDEVIAAAKHSVVEHQAIDTTFLAKTRKRVGDALKRAMSKVLGFLEVSARTMHLDKLVPIHRLRFLKLHELGHGLLPWQRDMYALTEDCEKTIDPEIGELFERESNAFASEVLFQLDGFTREAADMEFGIKVPLKLSKRYGASAYSAVRRYVSTHDRSCAVVVLNPPILCPDDGFRATLHRVVCSKRFELCFGDLRLPDLFTPDDDIGRMVPTGGRKMSRPRNLVLNDQNGTRNECMAEAFAYRFYVFVLIYPVAALTRKTIIMSA